MDWRHDLGNQLRSARKDAHITQEELAKKLNVSRQMVVRYEAGTDTPGFDVISLAAGILETEFQVLNIRVKANPEQAHTLLRSVPKQLSFEFNKPRRFTNAVIKITPHRGRIIISADIPA